MYAIVNFLGLALDILHLCYVACRASSTYVRGKIWLIINKCVVIVTIFLKFFFGCVLLFAKMKKKTCKK